MQNTILCGTIFMNYLINMNFYGILSVAFALSAKATDSFS